MSDVVQTRRRISCGVFGLSVFAWLSLTLLPRMNETQYAEAVFDTFVGAMCINGILVSQTDSISPMAALSGANTLGWAMMVVAMMFPTLINPLTHIAQQSFRDKRIVLMTVFLLAYLLTWTFAGLGLLSLSLVIRQSFSESPYGLTLFVLLIALIWQCTPLKQRCLNRNHQHPALRAYGLASYVDAGRVGLSHGRWCVGSCWALMLFSTVSITAHQPIMLLLTFIMLSESMQVPRPPAWAWRLIPSRKLRGLAMR